MSSSIPATGLDVAPALIEFIRTEALPGTGVAEQRFWSGLAAIARDLAPRNAELLRHRDHLQAQIDAWHRTHAGPEFNRAEYRAFLEHIGYLEPPVPVFHVDTENVDVEIASIAAPQLVVPLDNARYALNAANARWGSLFDALYGTDAIAPAADASNPGSYDPVRGGRVIGVACDFLDACLALQRGSYRQGVQFSVSDDGTLYLQLDDGTFSALRDQHAFRGYTGQRREPTAIFLLHHGLHVEVRIDRQHPVGRQAPAGICDVVLESAVTTIQDCEDSVAAVDAEDKVRVYRNWLGLMAGTLNISFRKGRQQVQRSLAPDRQLLDPTGAPLSLPGRSLMLVRHVGQHIASNAVSYRGSPVPECFVDALITALIGMHDGQGTAGLRNSRTGSIYCVKPKMHGSAEVALADELFGRVEQALGLPALTLKLGLMDEERRTSLNLRQCLWAARHRIVFINTGFLDRTGDDIHTSMAAGATLRKQELRRSRWLAAYERHNVDVGLSCGLRGHAQIGKGMWTQPDGMATMLVTKVDHLRSGASTSWVPSPTAATLHALHYHQVDVPAVQAERSQSPPVELGELIEPALLSRGAGWSREAIDEEIDSNVQSILGYVVRWIDAGVGCSKVPDLTNTALMEDRATLRISSQIMGNWLQHSICSRPQVEASMLRMARVVDMQNASDPGYRPMCPATEYNLAFQAARELVFSAAAQPNGYTEEILFRFRRLRKQSPVASGALAASGG